MSLGGIHLVLKNRFYIGEFRWREETFQGTHLLFIDRKLFDRVQNILAGHNRPKYSKRDVSFRGMMTCANDGCMLTADVQKEKYVYYRCTGNRGKCDLPRLKEEVLSERMAEPLKSLQVQLEVVAQILTMLRDDQGQAASRLEQERTRLGARLISIQNRMDAAYFDRLDGKIPEDFWERKMAECRAEEQQVKLAIDSLACVENTDRALDAQRVFELANKAYLLYFSQDSTEKAKLLRMICSNFFYRRCKRNAYIQIPLQPYL